MQFKRFGRLLQYVKPVAHFVRAMLYAEDATLYDPETVATGRDAISGSC